MPNPERGFYGWSGNDFVTALESESLRRAFDSGQRLVFARVDLGAYRECDLSAAWLAGLERSFAVVRAAGLKVTLLFAYDFSEAGQDATALRIKRHLEQLRPVLAAHAAVVPYMRAGFIGAWGEWHSSRAGNSCGYNAGATTCTQADVQRAIVRDALLANVPATTQIAFRYPEDLRKWYPEPTRQQRLGLHNDCFLAGATDTGTYSDPTLRGYARALSRQAAFGGETCEGEAPLRTTCADILAEGAQYHLAWLNNDYARSVIDGWAAQGCLAAVSRSMGYRLQLDAASHPEWVERGVAFEVQIDLRNVGWARLFTARPLAVVLRHRDSGVVYVAAAGDLSALAPQSTRSERIVVPFTLPTTAPAGDYVVLLGAPDSFAATRGDARFAIRFANADDAAAGQGWNAAVGGFTAGTRVRVP